MSIFSLLIILFMVISTLVTWTFEIPTKVKRLILKFPVMLTSQLFCLMMYTLVPKSTTMMAAIGALDVTLTLCMIYTKHLYKRMELPQVVPAGTYINKEA